MSNKHFLHEINRSKSSLVSKITEFEGLPDGLDIKGNIRHSSLSEVHNGLQIENVSTCTKELSELPFGENIFTFPKFSRSSLDKAVCSSINAAKQKTLDINSFMNSVSIKSYGQSIPSNIQHLSLAEAPPPMTSLDVRKVIMDIQKNTSLEEKSLHDKAGIIQKNERVKAINDIAKSLSRMLTFMVYRKMLCLWRGNIWAVLDITSFITLVRENLPNEPLLAFFSTKNYEELFRILLTDPDLQVTEDEVKRPTHQIVFTDGVIDILTGQRNASIPQHYCFTYINMSVMDVGRGNGVIFEKFINNSTDGNKKIRQLILEMIGVIISGYMLKVIFLILGPKNSGKSQLISFLRLLVGEMNCESINNLNGFSERWTTGRLLGKKLCICPEVPKETINAQSVSVMKQLVGGDLIYGDQKYKMPFSFINEAKLVIASNHKLQISNAEDEDAFISRIITIPFKNSIPQDQKIGDIYTILFQERGYITAQAIEALKDLQRRNFVFTEVETSAFYVDTAPASDSIFAFCEQECIFNSDSECTTTELYRVYLDYCSETGIHPEAMAVFARTLSNRFPRLEHLRKANGVQKRGFRGITLKDTVKKKEHHEK